MPLPSMLPRSPGAQGVGHTRLPNLDIFDREVLSNVLAAVLRVRQA